MDLRSKHWFYIKQLIMLLCFHDFIKVTSSTNNDMEPPQSDEEILNYFETCPQYYLRFKNTCQMDFLSCNGKCGTSITFCSCQPFCRIRNDCCFDYEHSCPEDDKKQINVNKHTLELLNNTCQNNYRIFEGNGEERSGEIASTREFVVFDKITGLSFRNIKSYNYHKRILASSDASNKTAETNVGFWDKKLKNTRGQYLNPHDVQVILAEGSLVYGIEIVDDPPQNAEQCSKKILLECSDRLTDRGNCKNDNVIVMDNVIFYCQFITQMLRESELASNSLENLTLEQSCRFEKYRTDEIGTFLGQLVTITKMPSSLTATNKKASLGPPITWNSFQITKRKNSSNPIMDIDCSSKYIPVNSECRIPKHILFAVRKNTDAAKYSFSVGQRVTQVVHFLMQHFNIVIDLEEQLLKKEISTEKNDAIGDIMIYTTHIEDYDIEMTTNHFLPFTEKIAKFITEGNLKSGTNLDKMVICLSVADSSGAGLENGSMSCDHLTISSSITLNHFEVRGFDELNVKINTFEEQLLVNSRKNAVNNGSCGNHRAVSMVVMILIYFGAHCPIKIIL